MKIPLLSRIWKGFVNETKPRPTTSGNLETPSYFLATFQAATEGFYFMGPLGAVSSAAASATGVWAAKKTHSSKVGVVVGAATGAVLQGVLSAATGGVALPIALTAGALMGAQQVFRGDDNSVIRDSAGNATLMSAWFVPGYGKLAGGIASGLASRAKTTKGKILRGAIAGLVLGGALGALGLVPGGFVVAALASGLAGATGPLYGPKFSQFFRNLNEDLGALMVKGLRKLGLKRKTSQEFNNSLGAIPASFMKEGTRGMINADMDPIGFIVGGVSEVIQQAYIIVKQKKDHTPSPMDNS